MRYFVAVAEALSFTKAAERLRLAQPSLTRQVRNLEDEIGVRLLNRGNNRITLTEEGRVFLFDARKLLAQCADTVATVQKMSREKGTQLNVGYAASVHCDLLPATLGAFRRLCPRVAVNLFDMTSAEQIGALEANRIDLGFVGVRGASSSQGLLSACVAHDRMLAALPSGHVLAKKTKVKLSGLAAQFLIGMSPRTHPGEREWLVNTCRTAGFAVRILQDAETETAAIRFVADGLGVALLPEQITNLPHEGVVFRPLSPPLYRESLIMWSAANASKALSDYREIVRDLARAG